jgi:hypothetical protein
MTSIMLQTIERLKQQIERGMSVAMPRPLCGIVIDRFGGRGWSFALSVHKSPVPIA